MTTLIKSLQQSKSKTPMPTSQSSSTTTATSQPSGSELSVTTIIEPPSPYPSPSHSSVYTRKSQSDLSERHARTLAVGNQLEIPMNVRDLRRHSASDLGKTSKVIAQAIPEHEVVNSARMEQEQQQGKYNKNEPRKSTSDVKAGKDFHLLDFFSSYQKYAKPYFYI